MDKKFIDLPLRKGVGVALLNNNNQIFVAKRIDNPNDFWQMPQGGIDKGENPLEAAFRELKEETGIGNADVEILGRTKTWHYYNVPKHLIKKENRSFYKGQRQIWFLLKFNGLDTNITFSQSEESEFDAWKWIEFFEAPNMVIQFKKQVYCSALLELAPIVFESSKLEDIKIRLSL